MRNYYDKNRFISKRELARLADVSPRTFCRYLASRRHILNAMGISPKAQTALQSSPIRDLILQTWESEQDFLSTKK